MKLFTAFLLVAALVWIQLRIGGTRLHFAFEAYAPLALAALVAVPLLRRSRAQADPWCIGTAVVVFAWLLGRAVLSPVAYLWWPDFFTMLGCLVVYLLVAWAVPDVRSRLWIAGWLLALALFEAFVGLRQFTIGDWLPFGFERKFSGRASGTLISPNHFAGMMELLGPLALSCAAWSTWSAAKRGMAATIAFLSYGALALSGSRGGYVSAGVSVAVFAIVSVWVVKRSRVSKFPRALTAALVLGGVALFGGMGLMMKSDRLGKRLEKLAEIDTAIGQARAAAAGKAEHYDVRALNWAAGFDQLRVSPLTGTGAGTHLYYGRLFRRPALQWSDPEHVHSDWLELAAEYGLIGLAGALLLAAAHLARGWKTVRETVEGEMAEFAMYKPLRHDVLALQLGALCAIVALLIHSVVDFNLHIPGNALLLAFAFGLLAAPRATHEDDPHTMPRAAWLRWALPGVGVALAALALPKYAGESWAEKTRIAVRDEKPAEAVAAAAKGLAHEKRNPFLYFHAGQAHAIAASQIPVRAIADGHLAAAAGAFRASLAIFPNDARTWLHLARVLDMSREFPEAEAAYRRALELDPKLGLYHGFFAAHWKRRGHEEKATEFLKQGEALLGDRMDWVYSYTFTEEELRQ